MSSVTNFGSSSYFCVAEGCNSDERKRGRYGYMANVRFHPFPTKKKASSHRKRWLELLRRKNYEPKRNHRVCSLHFVDEKPTEKHPFPELFAYNNFKDSQKIRSTTSITKREQSKVPEPQIQISTEASAICESVNIDEICYSTGDELNGCWPVTKEVEVTDNSAMNIISYPSTDTYVEVEHCYTGTHRVDDVQTREIGIQTSMTSADIDRLEKKGKRLDNPDQLMRELFVTKVTKNDKSVQKYTGLPSKQSLGGLFGILDKASPVLKYWSGQGSAAKPNYQSDSLHPKSGPKRKLTRFHEFLLTLVRLRLALSTFVIADLFGVSSSRVSQVFATWINFMYIIFTPLLKWLQGM